jgi:hypothetical protein
MTWMCHISLSSYSQVIMCRLLRNLCVHSQELTRCAFSVVFENRMTWVILLEPASEAVVNWNVMDFAWKQWYMQPLYALVLACIPVSDMILGSRNWTCIFSINITMPLLQWQFTFRFLGNKLSWSVICAFCEPASPKQNTLAKIKYLKSVSSECKITIVRSLSHKRLWLQWVIDNIP